MCLKNAQVDTGSGQNIIYEKSFLRLPKKLRETITPPDTEVIGFAGERIRPLGEIWLDATIGGFPWRRTAKILAVVIRANSPYDMLLGSKGMRKFHMIASTIHGCVQYKSHGGIQTLLSSFTDDTKRESSVPWYKRNRRAIQKGPRGQLGTTSEGSFEEEYAVSSVETEDAECSKQKTPEGIKPGWSIICSRDKPN